MPAPRYNERMLIRLVRETKNIDDLCSLCQLFRDLEAQGDLTITPMMRMEVKVQQEVLIYLDETNSETL